MAFRFEPPGPAIPGGAFAAARASGAQHGFRWRCGGHPWRHVLASDHPDRPSMAGRSAGHAAVPR